MSTVQASSLRELPKGQQRLVVAVSLLRVAASVGIILWMYALVPTGLDVSLAIPYVVLGVLLVVYILQFRSQLGRIQRAKFPGLRSAEALVVSAVFFLTIFAGFYVMMYGENPESFSQPITHVSGLYFTVTVFATVGFGDIVAKTDFARSVVTVQMLLGIGFLALIVKIFFGTAQETLRRRREKTQSSPS